MDLHKINGNSYWIEGPTNTGVFLFKNKYTLLVDTGDGKQQARQVAELLKEQGWQVKYIFNTHEHPDHCGGNQYMKDSFPGSVFHASAAARQFMEDGMLAPLYMYGGSPPDDLARHYTHIRIPAVDEILSSGTVKINDERFELLPLPGHARGQMGLATRDRVCFLGDALFSPEIIAKYSFPFLFDIESQLKTIQLISSLEYDFYVLGHASQCYTRAEMQKVVQANRGNLDKYLALLLELLDQPKSREELAEELIILEDLNVDFKEYFYILSTLAAFLTYLTRRGELKHQLENGRLYYFRE